MILIESARNERFRRYLSLLEGGGIKAEGLALLGGRKVIDELRARDPDRIREILLAPDHEPLDQHSAHVRLASPLFKELDVVGTRAPLAVITAPALDAWTPAPPRGLNLILALSDPNNLGACLRSAEAFGVARVILTEECSSPYLPRALRASVGSALRVPMVRAGRLSELAVTDVIGLDAGGTALDRFEWPTDVYLALGEEGRGLPANLAGPRIAIPMQGEVESLNATVAASLALYAHARARYS